MNNDKMQEKCLISFIPNLKKIYTLAVILIIMEGQTKIVIFKMILNIKEVVEYV